MKRPDATAKLVRVLRTLDAATDLPLDVREVQVFGSYAAGAVQPRDLDLIVVFRPTDESCVRDADALSGRGTSSAQQMNARLKRSNGERIHVQYETSAARLGTRLTHTDSHPIVLVWRRGEPEDAWRRRIAGLPERSDAGRAPRPQYFLDPERCEARPDELEQVGDLVRQGVLSFSVVPATEVPVLVDHPERRTLEWFVRPTSRLKPLMDLGLRYINGHGREPIVRPGHRPQVWSGDGAIEIDCGRPRVGEARELLRPKTPLREWCGIPRPRRGEPLVIWVFRRADGPRRRGRARPMVS